MSRVLLLVEGPTERAIVDQVFAPVLACKGVYLRPRVVGKPGHKGGNRFDTVRRELRALICQEPQSTVTMIFDYYGLPHGWPGLVDAKGKSPGEVPDSIEPAISEAVARDIGPAFNPEWFIPYIQLHEIESLLFAGPEEMAYVFNRPDLAPHFENIVNECGGCEKINDSPTTAPSKRIHGLFPGYKKGRSLSAHAYRITQRIGVARIRGKCPHFNEWFTKLEHLGWVAWLTVDRAAPSRTHLGTNFFSTNGLSVSSALIRSARDWDALKVHRREDARKKWDEQTEKKLVAEKKKYLIT